jgi:hypothetical protein
MSPVCRDGRLRFFPAFALASGKQKRSAGERRTNTTKKAEAPSAKEKSAIFLFIAPPWKPGSRAQSHSAEGKARVLSKVYVKYKYHYFDMGCPVWEFLSWMSYISCQALVVLS